MPEDQPTAPSPAELEYRVLLDEHGAPLTVVVLTRATQPHPAIQYDRDSGVWDAVTEQIRGLLDEDRSGRLRLVSRETAESVTVAVSGADLADPAALAGRLAAQVVELEPVGEPEDTTASIDLSASIRALFAQAPDLAFDRLRQAEAAGVPLIEAVIATGVDPAEATVHSAAIQEAAAGLSAGDLLYYVEAPGTRTGPAVWVVQVSRPPRRALLIDATTSSLEYRPTDFDRLRGADLRDGGHRLTLVTRAAAAEQLQTVGLGLPEVDRLRNSLAGAAGAMADPATPGVLGPAAPIDGTYAVVGQTSYPACSFRATGSVWLHVAAEREFPSGATPYAQASRWTQLPYAALTATVAVQSWLTWNGRPYRIDRVRPDGRVQIGAVGVDERRADGEGWRATDERAVSVLLLEATDVGPTDRRTVQLTRGAVVVQRILTAAMARSYLSNRPTETDDLVLFDPGQTSGVSYRYADVMRLLTPRDLFAELRLDYADPVHERRYGRPPHLESDDTVAVLRFVVDDLDRLAPSVTGNGVVLEPPLSGLGFASGRTRQLPEWVLAPASRLPFGAEMYQIDDGGNETLLGVYLPDGPHWASTDAGADLVAGSG